MFACRLCSNLGSKIVQTPKSLASMLKNIVSYPPLTHAFLKWPFLTDFKKYTHTPPYGMKFWCSGRKMEKTLKIHEFAPRWHILNVPERYSCTAISPGINHIHVKPLGLSELVVKAAATDLRCNAGMAAMARACASPKQWLSASSI